MNPSQQKTAIAAGVAIVGTSILKHSRLARLVVVGGLAAAVYTRVSGPRAAVARRRAAGRMSTALDAAEARLAPLEEAANTAHWALATDATDEHAQQAAEAQIAYEEALSDPALRAAAAAASEAAADPVERRRADVLHLAATAHQRPAALRDRIVGAGDRAAGPLLGPPRRRRRPRGHRQRDRRDPAPLHRRRRAPRGVAGPARAWATSSPTTCSS